ncbi:response regulator [Plasticicumulans acidivorans]|uniref:Winged helix family two component transcriptional regulator n=1 Tax=Plasticicumulans acidivorans TaxID=886464 RepID=A0A317MYN1_9GAMM|nr:response regulator [Plasticicumulans acidivorans]PWV64735.1 winged helix family two component transcriptional regulator [Plasticicumulans acidivorans]
MRLLLVEDDRMIGRSVEQGLKLEGHAVDWVLDGLSAERALAETGYDLLLLDLGLPHKDGLEVLRGLRAGGQTLPVLILTARDALAERIAGLDAGADDYVIKPFELDELAARIRALLRRGTPVRTPLLEHGRLKLDPATHEVWCDGEPVTLSAREFELLHALLREPGKPQSRARLEEQLYGWGQDVESNAVEVHIHALRRKLGAEAIRNLRGVGWFVPKQP